MYHIDDLNKNRCYFVIDMKSFFASVECVERGLDAMITKLVVADESRTDKTICLAVSPALKALGVKNRCRLFEVPKNLDFIIAKPRMKKYIEYAAKIYSIYLKYISKDDIHVYSIDECFIDATDYLKIYKIRAKDFAKQLTTEIWEKLGIPASAGIGTNMYLAKIALDITAKHSKDRIGWLTEEKFIDELWHHKPLSDFWGISTGVSNRLARFGIFDMAGIANFYEDTLYKEFGINAELLIDHANGKESCLMEDIKNYKGKSKSFSSSQILPVAYSFHDAKIVINEMIQEGCYRLAKSGCVTNLVQIIVGFDDKTWAKGTKRLSVCTNLFSQMKVCVNSLFDEICSNKKMIRRLGFSFGEVKNENCEGYDLFTDISKITKEKKVVKAVLNIKDKYGKNSILKGTDFLPNATQKDRNKQIGGHNSDTDKNAKN